MLGDLKFNNKKPIIVLTGLASGLEPCYPKHLMF